MESINVGIIEDDKIIHQSLKASVEMYPAMNLVFDAYSSEEAIECLENPNIDKPNVVLLDIGLPGLNGIQTIPLIKKISPDTDIIMLTTYDETEKIFACLSAGACSYISKKTSLKIIMDAIFTVFRGGSYMSPSIARKIANHFQPIKTKEKSNLEGLSERQSEILNKLAEGKSYRLISEELFISIDTVRSHIKKIYKTLQVNSKVEAINVFNQKI